ncbi:MAG: tetraacyldisaccharide 4'-kinase [Rhizomicrobium sp.]
MRAPEFWSRRGAASALLSPLGALYGASVALKARVARPFRAAAVVISVGNLTAGGSGKTPLARAVGARLLDRGRRVFFLTRGYGGREAGPYQVAMGDGADRVGDEALLLAERAPTIVARRRAEGARLAVARGAEIIVMDDGHQNFSVVKDLSLVVVDGESQFGNGCMIPAGPLREPVRQGLARADAVIVMGSGNPDLGHYRGTVLSARLLPEENPLDRKRVFAFSGIGRPEKFVATLHQVGAFVDGARFFADHHRFAAREIAALRKSAAGRLLVTTEKDFVRLKPADREGIVVLKVRALFDDDHALAQIINRVA